MSDYKPTVLVPWFKRIFFPLFFLILSTLIITKLVYRGQKHRQVSAQIENKIIDFTFYLSKSTKNYKSIEKSYKFFSKDDSNWTQKILFLKETIRNDPEYLFIFGLGEEKHKENKIKEIHNISKTSQTKIIITESPNKKNFKQDSSQKFISLFRR